MSSNRHVAGVAVLLVGSLLLIPLVLGPSPLATAAWSAGGAGSAGAAADVMPTGSTPTGIATSGSVTVSWPAAVLSNGTAVAGYVINRLDAATGAPASVGSGCSGIITTTTCTESGVPAGSWVYTDTPVEVNWTGGVSPASTSIVVS